MVRSPIHGRRAPLALGMTIGDYELIDIVGEGSFAVVWEARHRSLDRVAAIKILHGAKRNDRDTLRFLREAQLGARLRHPFVVQVYDCGYCPDGDVHYMATELIEGVSLGEWVRFNKLDFHGIAELLQKVASGLDYAHNQSVVHRDLKPDNVIIDLSGNPHITDFGLARDLDRRMTETNLTIGTVVYMSPEQGRGDSDAADARSDVYAVGAIMFELLTGRLPFDTTSLAKHLSLLAKSDAPSPHLVRSDVPRDLSMICAKCLRVLPQDRYATAADLADDLDRFMRRQPVRARPLSRGLRAVRWSAANRWASLTLAVLAAVTVAAPLAAVQQYRQRLKIETLARDSRARQYASDMYRAFDHRQEGELRELKTVLAAQIPKVGQVDLRGFEWFFLEDWLRKRQRVIGGAAEPLYDLVDLRSRGEIAVAAHSGKILVWDDVSGRLLRTIEHQQSPLLALEKTPDDKFLLAPGTDGSAKFLDTYDLASGKWIDRLKLELEGIIESVKMSPDGKWLAIVDRHHQVLLLDWPAKRILRTLQTDGRHNSLAFSPDSALLAVAHDKGVRVWKNDTGELVVEGPTNEKALSVAWSADGKEVIVSRNAADQLTRLSLDGRQDDRAIAVATDQILYLSMVPNGRHLWAGGLDGSIHRISVPSTEFSLEPTPDGQSPSLPQSLPISGHAGRLNDLEVRADGECISIGQDGELIGTRVKNVDAPRTWRVPTYLDTLAFLPNTRTVVCGGHNGILYVDGVEAPAGSGDSPIRCLEPLGDGSMAIGLNNGRVRFWSAGSQASKGELTAPGGVNSPRITAMLYDQSTDGLILGASSSICSWLPGHGAPMQRLKCTNSTRHFAYWGAENLLFAGGPYADVLALDAASFTVKYRLENGSGCNALVVDAERNMLVTAHNDSTIRVWDLRTRCERFVLQGHDSVVRSLDLHPAGHTLVSASNDGTVRLWRLEIGQEYGIACSLLGHDARCARFSADGQALAAVFPANDRQSSEVRVWEVGAP